MALPSIHDRESLHGFIASNLNDYRALPEPQMRLPDEEPPDPAHVTFMAGAKDGAFGHHFGGGTDSDRASKAGDLLIKAAAKPTKRRLRKLYEVLSKDDALDYVDPMIEHLAKHQPSTAEIAAIGTWLATESPDRGPVKIGIALLGITGAPDGTLLHELGAHEEFTLFSSVAFSNSRADPEPDLFTLGKAVSGWGRIHCVERLSTTDNPEIQQWILRDGFRNAVMYEYLAYIAATTGDLATALDSPKPDRELLTAAADIIQALIIGGPAENVDDYDDAPLAVDRFVRHMAVRAEAVADFLAVSDIHRFLESEHGWEQRLTGLWSDNRRTELTAICAEILGWDKWPVIVTEELASEDRQTFWQADRAAQVLGIDTFDRHLQSIDSDPLDGSWYQAWQIVGDEDRAQILASRATDLLDLKAIATGPSTAIGLGPEFKQHAALGWSLQGIKEFPAVGPDLIEAGLSSPSIQNRNGAMNALEEWGPSSWTPGHVAGLERLASVDPHEKAKHRARELLDQHKAQGE